MFKKLLSAAVLAVSPVIPFHANAVTFDFVAYAAGNEGGASSLNFVESGLGVAATGSDTATGAAYFAYLDDVSGGPGGLGVCQNLTSLAQCNPPSDDNVTFGESLKLFFSQPVTIDQITFNNGDHKQIFLGDFTVSIGGGPATPYSLVNVFTTPLTGTEFVFSNPNAAGGSAVSNEYQFYIGVLEVTPVPVPAAVWLFATGLIGLVAVARRGS